MPDEHDKSRASRMMDELIGEGLGGQVTPAPKGPVLPRMRLVVGAQVAPVLVTKRKSVLAPGKAAIEMLPQILKEVDEARRVAAAAAETKAALESAVETLGTSQASGATFLPKDSSGDVAVGRGMSRVRRRFNLIFGKWPSTLSRPHKEKALHAEFEDKAIYRSGDEKPLRVPDSIWQKPGIMAWAFLLPALLAFAFFVWAPMIKGLILSFQNVSLTGESSWVGGANYARAFSDPQFWATFGHAFIFCALSLGIGFFLPVALAIYMNELRRGQGILRLAFFLPFLTPAVPAVILWKWILDQGYGVANSVLYFLGLNDPHVPWLNHPGLAMLSVTMVFLWKNTGWNALIYLASLREVPEELYEASEIDGAPVWRRIWHISLPSLRTTMGVLFLMQVINSFQIFTEVYLLTGGGPMASTEVVATYLYKKSFLYLDIGYASALAVILFMVLASFTGVRARAIRREA